MTPDVPFARRRHRRGRGVGDTIHLNDNRFQKINNMNERVDFAMRKGIFDNSRQWGLQKKSTSCEERHIRGIVIPLEDYNKQKLGLSVITKRAVGLVVRSFVQAGTPSSPQPVLPSSLPHARFRPII